MNNMRVSRCYDSIITVAVAVPPSLRVTHAPIRVAVAVAPANVNGQRRRSSRSSRSMHPREKSSYPAVARDTISWRGARSGEDKVRSGMDRLGSHASTARDKSHGCNYEKYDLYAMKYLVNNLNLNDLKLFNQPIFLPYPITITYDIQISRKNAASQPHACPPAIFAKIALKSLNLTQIKLKSINLRIGWFSFLDFPSGMTRKTYFIIQYQQFE